MSNKKELRTEYLKIRDALSEGVRLKASAKIWETLLGMEEYQDAENVLVYADYKSEVFTTSFVSRFLGDRDKKFYFPRVVGNDMEFYEICDVCELEEGYKGIKEPRISDALFDEEISKRNTVVIVPGAVFDIRGYRIGYGKGFYDRFLKKYPSILKIGIAFETQMCKNMISNDFFDIAMDYVITEKGIYKANE